MQEVSFQFSVSENPSYNNAKGIGIDEGIFGPFGIIRGELKGFFSFEGKDYLMTKADVTFEYSDVKKGNIDVREALFIPFSDHSGGNFYVAQDKDEIAAQVQKIINQKNLQEKPYFELMEELNLDYPNGTYDELSNTVAALAIRNDVLERKRQELENKKTK